MYTYHIYIYICFYIYIYIYIYIYVEIVRADRTARTEGPRTGGAGTAQDYTRSPLEDPHLFGPSPWKILRHYLCTNGFLSNPAPGENILSGNLVMETGCKAHLRGSLLPVSVNIYIK